jgi:hypothetical protein
MRKLSTGLATLLLAVATTIGMAWAQDKDDEKPKFTIKEVMKTAHKGGLLDKVAKGTASEEEKKQLAELYVALHKHVPPKGSPESWKEKTEALVKASKDVLAGKEGSAATLKKVANCQACHKEHKGK